MPEAWYEQDDKYNLFLLSFLFLFIFGTFLFLQHVVLVILFCSFCDVKLVVTRCAFTVCFALVAPSFGIAVVKRNHKPRSKAKDGTSVWIFWYFTVFVPASRNSLLWREVWQCSRKSPINILVQTVLVRPLHLKVLPCWKKQIFGLVESGFSPAGWVWL